MRRCSFSPLLVALFLLCPVLARAQTAPIGLGKITIVPPTPEPPGLTVRKKARTVPTKEALQAPAGQKLRLLVKFRDGLKARAAEAGELVVRASTAEEVNPLATLVRGERIRFRATMTAPDAKLEALRQRAEERTGVEAADLAGLLEIEVDATTTRAQLITLAQKFHRLAEVEYVALESIDLPPPPPAADIAPPTPSLTANQTYRTSSGINSDAVWTKYGARGTGVRVTDCEYQYNPLHEDLSGQVILQSGISSMYTGFGSDHGTATLGELAAAENSYGMTGIAPGASLYFYPEFSTRTNGTTQSRSAAVIAAITDSSPGDVVMLEMQTTGPGGTGKYVPAEYDITVWNAVKTGTDAGVIVVAAAGNGAENLDSAPFASYMSRGDSGAIIVGAASAARARLSFSTYGNRVNVQGRGEGVATTGYGTFATYGSDPNQTYTSTFNGTSSATPIVTGAVVLIQSLARETIGRSLSPMEMRTLLRDTGKAQTGAALNVGPLPDVEAAMDWIYSHNTLKFTTRAGWGRYYYGTASPNLSLDSDNDRTSNLLEYFFGTNPTVNLPAQPTGWPTVTAIGNVMRYTFSSSTSLTDVSWKITATDALINPNWQQVLDGINGATITRVGDVVTVTTPITNGKRFIRLEVTALP